MKDDQGITIMISALPVLTALLLAPPATLHAADLASSFFTPPTRRDQVFIGIPWTAIRTAKR
jgi:DUF1365 family protein